MNEVYMKKTLAVYRSHKYSIDIVMDYEDREDDYTCISEPVEIEFKLVLKPKESKMIWLKKEIECISSALEMKTKQLEELEKENESKNTET